MKNNSSSMKNQLLQRKKREVIQYQTRKQLQAQFDWSELKSVSQLFTTEKHKAFFNSQLKDPTSAIAKAVKAGTKAHAALESGEAKDELNAAILFAFEAEFDSDLEEVWGLEEWLAHPIGLKGKFDGVGIFRGKLTLFDHKKTNKRKTRPQLKKYFDQLTGYRMAHNFLYPSHKIEQLAIFNIWGKTIDEIGAGSIVIRLEEADELELNLKKKVLENECQRKTSGLA